MRDLFDLTGKTALITGGGGLLGERHAEAILEFGGNVILADYVEDRAHKKSEQLNNTYDGERARGCFIDVTDITSITDACDDIEQIDILINNAARNPKVRSDSEGEWYSMVENNRFESMPGSYFQEGLDVTVNGCFLTSQIVVNKMLDTGAEGKYCREGGVILNIASDLGVIAPDQRIYKKHDSEDWESQDVKPIFYSAAKWAVVGMTKYLATYLATKNIRVNSLSPGGVYDNHPSDFITNITNLIPMGRMANADEYKGAVVFACSKASSYMTGHNLIVDGGRTVW